MIYPNEPQSRMNNNIDAFYDIKHTNDILQFNVHEYNENKRLAMELQEARNKIAMLEQTLFDVNMNNTLLMKRYVNLLQFKYRFQDFQKEIVNMMDALSDQYNSLS